MKAVIRQEDWSKGKVVKTQKFEYDIVLNKRVEVAYRDAYETQVFDDETRMLEDILLQEVLQIYLRQRGNQAQ